MARYIRLRGLASIVIVDNAEEIDALLDDPNLERDYVPAGPLINRVIIARQRRPVFIQGKPLLSFRPRSDTERQIYQHRLTQRLDMLAAARPWAAEALVAMAAYVASGDDRDGALAALTYVTAYPFLPGTAKGRATPFSPPQFARFYRLYCGLATARRLWTGLPLRLLNRDARMRSAILKAVDNDEYGLHAIAITLANSVIIMERMRDLLLEKNQEAGHAAHTPWWSLIRTAPALLFRQTKEPCRLLDIEAELPANTIVLLRARQALRPETPIGFEFATSHWSRCPAGRYMTAMFEDVWALATSRIEGSRATGTAYTLV